MSHATDPKTAALLTLVADPDQQRLLAWLLLGLDTLEQTDFGEIEPVGVMAPILPR